LVNFLALLGWNPGTEQELFTLPALVEAFDLSRMGKTAAKFDRDKLRWMNAQTIKETPQDRLVAACRDWASFHADSALHTIDDARLAALLTLYRERIQTLGELEQQGHFFFARPTEWGPAKAIKKHLLRGDGLERLSRAGAVLETVTEWTAEGINAALNAAAAAEYEGQLGRLAQPVRVAVAGGPVSPSIDETLVLLGKDETLARIAACSAHFAEAGAE
jgi:glutamyl-tRNA synthetase